MGAVQACARWPGGPVLIRKADSEKTEEIVGALNALRVSFAGLCGPSIYRQLCRDAVKPDSSVLILTAGIGQEIAGLAVAIIDATAYWRSVCWRRPFLAARIGVNRIQNRLKRRVRRHAALPDEVLLHMDFEQRKENWSDSGREIAKIAFIGTTRKYRRCGVARQLYDACFRVLADCGVNRVDASIERSNAASLFLHVNTGWDLREFGASGSVFCTKALKPTPALSVAGCLQLEQLGVFSS